MPIDAECTVDQDKSFTHALKHTTGFNPASMQPLFSRYLCRVSVHGQTKPANATVSPLTRNRCRRRGLELAFQSPPFGPVRINLDVILVIGAVLGQKPCDCSFRRGAKHLTGAGCKNDGLTDAEFMAHWVYFRKVVQPADA
jgi:hypothetical protein